MKQVNDHQEECLNILQEECAEVIQAASKIKRFGLVGKRLDSDTNLNNLETELGDVLAMVDLVKQRARVNKMERLSRYMHTWSEVQDV
jgi:NTP pyrophosphatase (non-canonical NTP hydrolase)